MKMSEREADMIARYRNGEVLEAIGRSYGISRERVRQLICKHVDPASIRPPKEQREYRHKSPLLGQREFVAARLAEGWTWREIGEHFGVTHSTVIMYFPGLKPLSHYQRMALRDTARFERIEEVVHRYWGGETVTAIGHAVGISSAHVIALLKVRGLWSRKCVFWCRDAGRHERIVAARVAGMRMTAIAAREQVSVTTVRWNLRKAGLRDRDNRQSPRTEAIAAMHRTGSPVKAIAQHFGIGVSGVHKALARHRRTCRTS